MIPPRKTNKQKGEDGELFACRYLEQKGYQLAQQNFRTRTGEIDLIMHDGEWLVFIEVKMRTSNIYGHGSEAVTATKQRTIRRTALEYLQQYYGKQTVPPIRFDIIVVTVAASFSEPEVMHILHAF
jgi:putative endonuclease